MKSSINALNCKQSWMAVFAFFICSLVHAQGTQDSLRDDDIATSIAPYSSDIRDAILDVSQYPQKLVEIERLQTRSSQSFQDLVSRYPREVQEKFYDLSRYPDLVYQLANGRTKSNNEVKTILSGYPAEVSTSVNGLYPAYLADLQSISKSYQSSQDALQNTVSILPTQTREDFKKIIGMPDVMNILTDRIDLTVSLGEAYKNNPDEVRQNLTSLHNQLSDQDEKNLEDYKQQVANDPQLQEEMKKSSQDFANNNQGTYDVNPGVINNYYTANPYPYWFGYPYWYSSPIWYPRPLYYHTGFYYGAGGRMVVIGMPSYTYSNWFFHRGYKYYPRMYGRYNAYYYNSHRNYNMSVYRGFNSASREHFYHSNNFGNYNGYNRYRSSGSRVPQSGYNNRQMQSRNITGSRSQYFHSYQPSRNSNGQRQNNITPQYHQQRSLGTMRSGGGGTRSSGHQGGGHGRGR